MRESHHIKKYDGQTLTMKKFHIEGGCGTEELMRLRESQKRLWDPNSILILIMNMAA